jgi:hypothetical protein
LYLQSLAELVPGGRDASFGSGEHYFIDLIAAIPYFFIVYRGMSARFFGAAAECGETAVRENISPELVK